MFKNMKIAINEQQPLDEVVRELERIGYQRGDNVSYGDIGINDHTIVTYGEGDYMEYCHESAGLGYALLITLSELKEME